MLSTRALCALIGLLSYTDTAWSSEKAARKPSGKQLWDKNEASARVQGQVSSRSSDLEEQGKVMTQEQEYVVKWQKLQGREKESNRRGQDKGEKKDLSRNKEVEPETDCRPWNLGEWGIL